MLYHDFYPTWRSYFTNMLDTDCRSNLTLYESLPSSSPRKNAACIDTALCMFEASVENIKTQSAATGVLLGLLPSTLALLGSDPIELALLSTRRPLLTLLLAIAAPVVSPLRLLDSVDLKEKLGGPETDDGSKAIKKEEKESDRRRRMNRFMPTIQVIFAAAAAANVIHVAYQLYSQAWSVVLACSGRYQIFIWHFLVLALWLGGFLSLLSRSDLKGDNWLRRFRSWAAGWFDNEMLMCKYHLGRDLAWTSENDWYFWISQALALGTVAHIFYGTAIFSAYQFVAPWDAFGILLRYTATAWVSRVILKIELSGMAKRTTVVDPLDPLQVQRSSTM